MSKQNSPSDKPSAPASAPGKELRSGHTEQGEMHSKDAHEAKTKGGTAPPAGSAVKK